MNRPGMEEVEAYLSENEVAWARLDRPDYIAARERWTSVFGTAFLPGMRYREGPKARHFFSQVKSREFLILYMANCHCPPFGTTNRLLPWFGYKCAAEAVPELSAFKCLEIAVVDVDFKWTMAHTHEDDAIGGPYFALRTWILPPDAREVPDKIYPKHRFLRKPIGKHIGGRRTGGHDSLTP